MLAEERRRRREGEPLAVDRERRRHGLAPVELLEDPERARLRMLGDLAEVVDRSDGNILERVEPVRRRTGGEGRAEQRQELLAVGDARGIRGEARVVDELRRADRRAEEL